MPESRLRMLAGLAEYLEPLATPPVLAAAAVRALLLAGQEKEADSFFQEVFPRSRKVRAMVVTGEIPVDFLRGVVTHPAASVTLRKMLARFASTEHAVTCNLIEDLLLSELCDEEHSQQVILKHPLTRQLVFWLRSGGSPDGAKLGARAWLGSATGKAPESNDAPSEASSLRRVGERLFEVSFVAQGGFLQENEASETSCPWANGTLDEALLARVPPTEDALALARKLLLRRLLRPRQSRSEAIEEGIVCRWSSLWPLGCWTRCRDPGLIGEAFSWLISCWRGLATLPGLGDLAGPLPVAALPSSFSSIDEMDPAVLGQLLVGTGSRRKAEELLFKMVTELEIWRLPPNKLLTPWVPGQVLVAHVTAQCKELEDRQLGLVEEARENLEDIARLNSVVSQLTSKLESTDARSNLCMQKQADLNNTIRQLQ